jgi:hypothetical protein
MSPIAQTDPSSETKRTSRPFETIVLPMRAQYRRSAVYVVIGMTLIAVARWGFRDFLPLVEGEPWRTLTLCPVPAVAALVVLRWALRVDSSGLARRRLFRWDLWSWESFEQGKVVDVEGISNTYFLPEKPFWARKLNLDLVEESDRSRVESIVDGLRTRPPLELPGEMALRYGFRKEALLPPGGLLLRDSDQETRYHWQDVRSFCIRRSARFRRDFESIEIVLPDRSIEFSMRSNQGQCIRSWSATRGGKTPSAEILAAFLERFIPRDRVQIDSLNEAPSTLEMWQARRAKMEKRTREHKSFRRILWVGSALLVLNSLSVYRRGSFAVLAMIGLSAVAIGLFFLVAMYLESDHRKELAELEAKLPGR